MWKNLTWSEALKAAAWCLRQARVTKIWWMREQHVKQAKDYLYQATRARTTAKW